MKSQYTFCKLTHMLFLLAVIGTSFMLAPSVAQAESDVCLGTRVNVTTLGFTPWIRLSINGREGWFAIDTGASYSMIDLPYAGIGASPGIPLPIKIAGFPYVESENFVPVNLSALPSPSAEGAMGIIGNNILSLVSTEFQYDPDSAHIVVSPTSCSPRLEGNPDFAEIKQSGYYSRDLLRLKKGEPNVPRLYMKIGTVSAQVYLDSGTGEGAEDRPTGSIEMNSAFIKALRVANIQMDRKKVLATITCTTDPQSRTQEFWLVSNQKLNILDADGGIIFQYDAPIIESMPAECDDLFSKQSPFGLVGASYFQRWGTVVLDAPGERVWVRRRKDIGVPSLPPSDRGGCSGTATYISSIGDHYDGDCQDGRYEGHGFLTLHTGDNYSSNFHKGLPEGQGELWAVSGDHYKGAFHNGLPEGNGELWYVTGDDYKGDFLKGLPEGQGSIKLHTRDYYVGSFKNGLPEGYGTLTWWASHDSFYGPFHNGKPDGSGTYTRSSDGRHYTVVFHEGTPVTAQ